MWTYVAIVLNGEDLDNKSNYSEKKKKKVICDSSKLYLKPVSKYLELKKPILYQLS